MIAPSRDTAAFQRLLDLMQRDARVTGTRALEGGVSAETTLLEIEQGDGSATKLVVRRHGPRDLAANPNVAADEFRLLRFLHAAGLAVPAPRYVDGAGDVLGSPLIVIDFVDGTDKIDDGDRDDGLSQMAAFLADLHCLDGTDQAVAFLSDRKRDVAAIMAAPPDGLDDSLSEGLVREALSASRPPAGQPKRSVLHGDYWPGNVLWRGGKLAAVIDWEDAAAGDPLADVSNARLELLWAYDADAMRAFTTFYQANIGSDLATLPLWDLYAALRPASKLGEWGLEPDEEREMRDKHRDFVQQALEALDRR